MVLFNSLFYRYLFMMITSLLIYSHVRTFPVFFAVEITSFELYLKIIKKFEKNHFSSFIFFIVISALTKFDFILFYFI